MSLHESLDPHELVNSCGWSSPSQGCHPPGGWCRPCLKHGVSLRPTTGLHSPRSRKHLVRPCCWC